MTRGDVIGGPERWARLLGWATLAGLACGISGPFGSYAANILNRSAYWIGLFWAGTGLLWWSLAWGLEIGARHRVPSAFAIAVAVLVGCVPLAMLAAAGCWLLWPMRASWVPFLQWYAQTLFVGLPGAAIAYLLELRGAQWVPAEAGTGRVEATIMPPLSADAPPGLPDHLVEAAMCLQMEDHHVRVHRGARSSLHLVPMREAVEQLGEGRGLQVHRSWWVARGAVERVEEDGRAATLVLRNGMRVPVARNRIASLRQSDWLRS